MKKLTVVFPIYLSNDNTYILMGKKAPGTKLAGYRNGYGGKCEAYENEEDCAIREVKEEINLDLDKEKLICIGKVVEGEKLVYFYIYILDNQVQIPDDENNFVDNRWFVLSDIKTYIDEMLPGNLDLMIKTNVILELIKLGKEFPLFEIDLTNNKEMMNLVENVIYR